ncbi:antibiotic biosynthesis monooxygenase [Shewanella cyperi]|uniref:Antibiotic biosynthesis monooxygenase n=1 Tax=Shewanella cyperi TaxID=2814292 RepID=A0A975AIX6_9GAMM|nr:antibiotic biosynthesis monooxygenase family protein [Shewanella cyperi]QSX28707.1 antibiotic biosynthesis monooxygenase [Shewanella cyperi]
MNKVSVINTITVPEGMERDAEEIRQLYVEYFSKQEGFVESVFYKSIEREDNGSIKYVNIVVWESIEAFNRVVNAGFYNEDGQNSDGYKVLGKGFPEPITVSPGRYVSIKENHA